MSFLSNSFRTWFRYFGLFTAITLAIWIPGNALVTTVLAMAGDDLTPSMALRLPMFVEGFLGPISIGAILFATDRLVHGESVRFGQAMSHGFSNWGRLFTTRFVCNFKSVLGLICFVIPGVVMLVRFAFVDQAVIVDNLGQKEARQRTWDLVPKVLGRLILLLFVVLGFGLGVSVVLYLPLEYLLENEQISMPLYYVGDVVASCLLDIMLVPSTIAMYFLYKEASGEPVTPVWRVANDGQPDETLELPPDDGNPYNAPHAH